MSNQTVLTKPTEALAARVATMPESLQLAALSYVLGLDAARKSSAIPSQSPRDGAARRVKMCPTWAQEGRKGRKRGAVGA